MFRPLYLSNTTTTTTTKETSSRHVEVVEVVQDVWFLVRDFLIETWKEVITQAFFLHLHHINIEIPT